MTQADDLQAENARLKAALAEAKRWLTPEQIVHGHALERIDAIAAGDSPRWVLVGGIPFIGYTGTTTYTDLKVYGAANTRKDAKRLTKEVFEQAGGLLLWIDIHTGKPADI